MAVPRNFVTAFALLPRAKGKFVAAGTREVLRVQRLAAANELKEILERSQRRLLVKAAGQSPVILQRIHYYEDPPFRGLWDA